jgi:hypothetical protein
VGQLVSRYYSFCATSTLHSMSNFSLPLYTSSLVTTIPFSSSIMFTLLGILTKFERDTQTGGANNCHGVNINFLIFMMNYGHVEECPFCQKCTLKSFGVMRQQIQEEECYLYATCNFLKVKLFYISYSLYFSW